MIKILTKKELMDRLEAAEKIIEIVAMYGRINHDRPKDYRELCQDYINEFMPNSQEARPKGYVNEQD